MSARRLYFVSVEIIGRCVWACHALAESNEAARAWARAEFLKPFPADELASLDAVSRDAIETAERKADAYRDIIRQGGGHVLARTSTASLAQAVNA